MSAYEALELDRGDMGEGPGERGLGIDDEAPYVALFLQLPIPCIQTTLGGTIRRANSAAARFLNVSPPFLIMRPLLHFVARGDCDAFRAAVECVASGRPIERVALRFRPRQRRPVTRVQLSGQRLHGASRRTIVWVMEHE